ncbi:hypothetical protein CIPAW_08G023300 [Carya illinoinensis]|uniref:Pentatricopeptide repeat-containing protein n=1 Tax=Carya illinoinensis TaxID=32201 RepID=A0A8T1PRS0_CARIL|nr:hypothetical protein CIPAW_08G023300 [Carya illinoinensis]
MSYGKVMVPKNDRFKFLQLPKKSSRGRKGDNFSGRGKALKPQCLGIPHPITIQRSFCDKPPNPNPLLAILLKEPSSRIKVVLDSEDSSALNSFGYSWEALLTSLGSLSPQKAKLVLEWRLEKMLKDNVRDHDSFSELMSLCGKVQSLPLAMRVFTSMEAHGVKPTSSVFNSLIHACLSSGNLLTAQSLFEMMERSEGYKPNSETYDAFIFVFSKWGNAAAMQAWYSAKKAAGFSADIQTYESLISGFVKGRNYDGADKLFEEMKVSGIMPNIAILDNMLEVLCKRRSFGQVKEFINFVLDGEREISSRMAERLMKFYVEVGTVDDMEELLVTLMNANQISEILSRVHSAIIGMYAMQDRLGDVEHSVDRMLKLDLSFNSPDDVEKVICSYFRRAAYDRLDVFLERIKGYYVPRRSTYDLLIAGYRRAGLSEKLDIVIKHMKSTGLS